MTSNKIKGGRGKELTNLQLRRRQWDLLSIDQKSGTKRPGSNKK